jgi:hypothetical protein
MNWTYIILSILIIVIIYILFFVTKNNKSSLVRQNYLANGIFPINMNTLKNFQSKTYSYELWININSFAKTGALSNSDYVASSNKYGNIFYITNCISLDIYNNGSIYVNIFNDVSLSYNNHPITNLLEMQRWQQIIISVNNNNILDLYLNGKIVKSIKTTVPTPRSNATINFGNADAYISKFSRLDGVMDTNTAWQKYLEGNAGIIPLHANVALIKDKIETRFSLF